MGTPGNRENQLVPRSVMIDFKDCALTISANILFQNGTALTHWRRRVKHLCCCNLKAWPRGSVLVKWTKVESMGNSKRPQVIFNMGSRSPRG